MKAVLPPFAPTLGTRRPSCLELALAFGSVTIFAFGGGAPWVRRIAVSDRRWLTADEFAEVTALCQSVPGAIFFNLAVAIGMRERGAPGAISALVGILVPALAVACSCERLEAVLEGNPMIAHALHGIVAAAAGLFTSTVVSIAQTSWARLAWPGVAVAVAVFCAVAIYLIPLPLVILAALPLSIAVAWRKIA